MSQNALNPFGAARVKRRPAPSAAVSANSQQPARVHTLQRCLWHRYERHIKRTCAGDLQGVKSYSVMLCKFRYGNRLYLRSADFPYSLILIQRETEIFNISPFASATTRRRLIIERPSPVRSFSSEAVTLSGEKNIDKAAEFIVERTLENGNC